MLRTSNWELLNIDLEGFVETKIKVNPLTCGADCPNEALLPDRWVDQPWNIHWWNPRNPRTSHRQRSLSRHRPKPFAPLLVLLTNSKTTTKRLSTLLGCSPPLFTYQKIGILPIFAQFMGNLGIFPTNASQLQNFPNPSLPTMIHWCNAPWTMPHICHL